MINWYPSVYCRQEGLTLSPQSFFVVGGGGFERQSFRKHSRKYRATEVKNNEGNMMFYTGNTKKKVFKNLLKHTLTCKTQLGMHFQHLLQLRLFVSHLSTILIWTKWRKVYPKDSDGGDFFWFLNTLKNHFRNVEQPTRNMRQWTSTFMSDDIHVILWVQTRTPTKRTDLRWWEIGNALYQDECEHDHCSAVRR